MPATVSASLSLAIPRVFPVNSSWETCSRLESPHLVHVLVTERCNLRCSYCYQHHRSRVRDLHPDAVRETLFRTLADLPAKRCVCVRFFGGEPLLAFDQLAALKTDTDAFWRRLGRPCTNLRYGITTNGTCFNTRIKRWLTANPDVTPALSLDGTPAVHDANRSSSYARIAPHLEFMRRYREPVKMTIGPASIGQVAASVRHIHALGFECQSNLVFENVWGTEDEKRRHLQAFGADLGALVAFYRRHPEFRRTTLLLPLPSRLRDGDGDDALPPPPCGLGRNVVAIDVDGALWPCDRIAPYLRSGGSVCAERRVSFQPIACRRCPLQPACPECRAANAEEHGDPDHKTTYHCEFTQLQLRASALLSLHDLVEFGERIPIQQLQHDDKAFLAGRLAVAQRILDVTQPLVDRLSS